MPTTECLAPLRLDVHPERSVEVTFDAPQVSSDGGLVLLRALDERLGMCAQVAELVPDKRDPNRIVHSRLEQVRQRIFQIALGYEDQNDATTLRADPLARAMCDRLPEDKQGLSSQPTLSRLEHAVSARDVVNMQRLLEDDYVCSLPDDTTAVVLDLDATDDPTHGQQPLSFFHGHYGHAMYFPLLVFDGEGRLVSVRLRPGNAGNNRYGTPLMVRLVRKIKLRFPHAMVAVRADSGFCTPQMLDALESLLGDKPNPRFVVTSLAQVPPQMLYENGYCGRGDAENRIKDFKNALAGDRLSCTTYVANAFRLLLHAFAYRLLDALRDEAAAAAPSLELESAQFDTLRLRLLKVAAVVRQSVRRITIALSKAFPLASIFRQVAVRLAAPILAA